MDESSRSISRIMESPSAVKFSPSAMASPPPTVATKVRTPTSATLNHSSLGNNRSRLSSAFTPFQAVMTPGYTPRGSQTGIVLLSPGKTITESLNILASNTAQQLEEIWDEVGYTPQERASQLSDLLVKFRDQCERKISEEQTVADTFRQTIAESKEELKSLGQALKAFVDPKLLRENSDQTLTDELSNLQETLEGLREEAAEAKAELQESLDYLVESHQALGSPLDTSWNDISSDLTVRRREEFNQKVEETKQEVATRTGAVIQILRDCQHLMNDLGIDGQNSTTPLDRKISGSLVRSKDSSFIMASKFETETCTGISARALEELSNRATELSGEKKSRKNMLQEMGAEIAMLWEQLRVPEDEQRKFTDSVKGLGMDTLQKGRDELDRLKALKATMIGNLVDEARQAIRDLWDETNATDTMRASFAPMDIQNEADFDDELLEKHEDYIRVLQERLEKMKPIIRIIERREVILRERMEYEELQKDSDRLKQRGAAMAKQLMEEEKMARRIKKDLPRFTKLLEQKLGEWLEETGEEFCYNGQMYKEMMRNQELEWTEYRASEMKLKLKKKQEEQQLEENKYLGKPATTRRKGGVRPLGDSNRQINENPSRNENQSRKHEVLKPTRPKPTVNSSIGVSGKNSS